MDSKKRIIVILGPTATGKSDLAVKIARKIGSPARLAPARQTGTAGGSKSVAGGEIISADSRQVYKGLNIGTGKITKKEMCGVPHHLLDVISPMVRPRSPQRNFSVSEWQKLAKEKIEKIIARGNTPIICGGTGLYIQSIVDNMVLPEVPPNQSLRKKLENKPVEELFKILKKIDSRRAENIEKKNPVRLIRAIEIATAIGKVPSRRQSSGKSGNYKFIQIGLTANPEVLKKRIHIRLMARLKKGMIAEARKLHAHGLSYKRVRTLGLEYRYLADFLAKSAVAGRPTQTKSGFRETKISKVELISKLDTEIYHYAKRQITWFKRDKRIKWFDVGKEGIEKKIKSLVEND